MGCICVDHMVGLDESKFLRRLEERDVKLYVSTISPVLLPLFGRYLGGESGIRTLLATQKLVPLRVNERHEIGVPSSRTSLHVTLLPAGHCPGSVM